ncbi:diaminopimelate epimerase [Bacillus timonensis]|nr:diaminopimelate epimerase [Bacillus timonensis]
MNHFTFTKMHGLGNNYIYVNMFEEKIEEELLSKLAIEVSNIHTGIGSDGLILICPSEVAPVKMRIFNNDGSEAMNCGNGLRCVAKYAYEHKLVEEQTFKIETLSGIVDAAVIDYDGVVEAVTINMGKPKLKRSEIPMLGEETPQIVAEEISFGDEKLIMTCVSMGNPHAIFYVPSIEEAPLQQLGPIIEKDERFPQGVNVEFVEVVSDDEIHFRVWERGSGITQACGTGACAAVVASVLNKKTKRNEPTVVHLAGGDLLVNWTDRGDVYMTGPATLICEGKYYY